MFRRILHLNRSQFTKGLGEIRKKLGVSLFFLLWVSSVLAEDGFVVSFTIEKTEENTMQSYANGVLMKFNESVRLDFENQYQIKIQSRPKDADSVYLTVTVKDQTSGKPYYVGVGAIEL